ncbi:MAG: hypothetical protein J7L26_12525 [Candidatus Aminicenantes bacterium]|nr:hypothetical protein [Candidatus Aminicenantes bacterium]
MAKLVDINEICEVLNYKKEEIEDLMRKKMMPHIKYADGKILFPLEEVLAKFEPKPKTEEPIGVDLVINPEPKIQTRKPRKRR